jgi:hypothetical protein
MSELVTIKVKDAEVLRGRTHAFTSSTLYRRLALNNTGATFLQQGEVASVDGKLLKDEQESVLSKGNVSEGCWPALGSVEAREMYR